MFSKRHYEWLASYWARELVGRGEQRRLTVIGMIVRQCREFERTESRFDAQRFMTACGMTEEEIG
jgi:hypothetical protein